MKKSRAIHIYNKVCRTALTMLCVASLFSCVKIELCMEEEHPHTGNVRIEYHWPEDIGDERPDSMLVLVNRIVNTRRVGYVTDAESSVGGRYHFGKVYRNDDAIATDGRDKYPLMVSAGEYQIFAFNNDVVDYRFENLDAYGDGRHLNSVGLRDLGVSYVSYDLTDPHLGVYGKTWIDFNPYAKYIATDVEPIYRAINRHDEVTQEYTFNVRAEEAVEVNLYPKKITQDITFVFPIYTDGQVTVDSIIAEISGIPRKMLIYTGTIVVDTTYKMLFEIDVDRDNVKDADLKVEEKGEMVEKTFRQLDCMATISVLGLIPNEDPAYRTGAGILQLCIYSHATDMSGEVKRKSLYAKINMYNAIREAHLLIRDEQGRIIQNPGTYEELPLKDTLRIENSRLIITKDLILDIYDDYNSLDTWIKGEDEDDRLDIEI